MDEFDPTAALGERARAAAVRTMPAEYSWPGPHHAVAAPRERRPIAQRLPWSPAFGPQICPSCYGAGWVRDEGEAGALAQCPTCCSVQQQHLKRQLALCWELGKIKPGTPSSLGFDPFPQSDAAAVATLDAAGAFARRPEGFLTIYGTYGGGKSGLGEAVARALLERREPCLFLNASSLFEYLGAVHRTDEDDTDYAGRMTWCVALPVLVVDELNMEGNSKAVADLRRSLIDARYQQAVSGRGGATMLLSNATPSSWYDQAVASRCLDYRFTCLESTKVDFRRAKR